jgi:hypothetical protein
MLKGMKLLGLFLIIVGLLFGSTINATLVRWHLNLTFFNKSIAMLFGTVAVHLIFATTFVGLTIGGFPLGINAVIFIGVIMLLIF